MTAGDTITVVVLSWFVLGSPYPSLSAAGQSVRQEAWRILDGGMQDKSLKFRLPRGGDRGVRQLTKPTISDTLESNRPYPVNGVVGRSDHESDPHLDR